MSEQEARSLGWVPQEEFRGDVAKWVDAETFVERGNSMVPLLKKTKADLEGKLGASSQEIARLTGLVSASQEAIAALQEFHDEDTKRQVAKAKAGLLAELEQAKRDGDTKLEVKLTDELIDLNAATKEAAAKPVVRQPIREERSEAVLDPIFTEFAKENSWFGTDMRKTSKAMGIAHIIRASEENDHLTGKAFMQKVMEGMEEVGRPAPSKVAGGGPTGSHGAGSSGKGFADLPADAKDACARQGKKLVGPGRVYKDQAAWQKKYTELYFQGE